MVSFLGVSRYFIFVHASDRWLITILITFDPDRHRSSPLPERWRRIARSYLLTNRDSQVARQGTSFPLPNSGSRLAVVPHGTSPPFRREVENIPSYIFSEPRSDSLSLNLCRKGIPPNIATCYWRYSDPNSQSAT